MIPTGIGAGFAFLVFIVPGFVLEGLLLNRRPRSDETAFRAANRVVVSSLLSSGLSVVVTSLLVFAIGRQWYGELQLWLTTGKYPKGLPIAVPYAFMIVEVAFALAIVWLWDHYWGKSIFGPRRLSPDSAWRRHLSDQAPQDNPSPVTTAETRHVLVDAELTSGRFLRGYVADFTPDHEWVDRELSLTSPIYERDESGNWIPVIRHIVLIPSASIVSLSVTHMYPEVTPVVRDEERHEPDSVVLRRGTRWTKRLITYAPFGIVIFLILDIVLLHMSIAIGIAFILGYYSLAPGLISAIDAQSSDLVPFWVTLKSTNYRRIVGFTALGIGVVWLDVDPGQGGTATKWIGGANGLLLLLSLILVLSKGGKNGTE